MTNPTFATQDELIRIARLGLAEQTAPEIVLWDNLDLDDPDDRLFGDYELLERIGRGGMGVVFRARQLSLGREVAIKFIVGSLADNARAVERFLAEARAAARLHHPHIVPVLEVGSIEGMHFFTMPLMRAMTLALRMAGAKISEWEVVALALNLGSAVDYAHSLGLLHLDLKPANVLFDEHDQPLIADFGLARHMDEGGGIDADEISGTPGYMAPEQGPGGSGRLGRQTDVYALGAILRELLSGSGAQVDRNLAAICGKCLQADPSDRYQTVTELTSDLSRYRDGNSISARTSRWPERTWRSVRRHPSLSFAIAAAIALLLAGLGATNWQRARAQLALAEASKQRVIAASEAERSRQLAGLMAAAFPSEQASHEARVASARDAVAWLKQHTAGDPVAQRSVLTAFREALTTEGKSDAIDALFGEILDQLGEDYREAEVTRLVKAADRDSLIAAGLIGIPRGVDQVSSAAHDMALRRLFAGFPDDKMALYVAALSCHVQPTPCGHPEYYERLVSRFPDNAVHWILAPRGATSTEGKQGSRLIHAAKATVFDDYHRSYSPLLRKVLDGQAIPDSIRQPMQAVVEASEVAPSFRRYTIGNIPLPYYREVILLCKPDSNAISRIVGLHSACSTFAKMGMRSPGSSILSRMVSSAILRRLYKGTPLEFEAREYRRQYVWLNDHASDLPGDEELLQLDIERYGEWEAWQRQAERLGVTRKPPEGWVPSNPQLLLLTEDRKSTSPDR
jgi:hypothetical protein